MSKIPLVVGIAGAGGTYYAIRNTKLPLAGKVGVSLVGGAVSFFAGRAAEKMILGVDGAEGVKLAKTEKDEILKNNLHLPPGERVQASYTPQQMQVYADKLYKAMDGAGTTEAAVDEVFKAMNNDLDILLLIEKFGVRDDDNLQAWLDDDGCVDEVNKILETKSSISKRF